MTNRETMPGATGKIPKNADNKNESSRARPPIAGARWRRRCRCRPQRQPTRGARCVLVAVGDDQNTSAYPFGSNFREESQSDKASRRVASVAAGREKYRG
ncbi:hypothetical protein ALC62_15832 [Cyphomyrmex costatus]|uniref:Uncharacterized protein n=1 Tax=Cyphomyrmex costatus TaxID=456900 RepID=A0A195BXU0_9HYME|nr:hypothetical protein ALC62_15832 [Cyphomyrmex costatus]